MNLYRAYKEVGIMVTTRCNQACPDCCFGLLMSRPPFDVPMDDILKILPFLRGSETVWICGGEPTIYPGLADLILAIHEIVAPPRFAIATNGANLDALGSGRIDELRFNDHYVTDEMRRWAKKHHPEAYVSSSGRFTRFPAHGSHPCDRIQYTAIMYDRAYPCCVGPEFADCPTTQVSDGWKDRLRQLTPPCVQCRFRQVKRIW